MDDQSWVTALTVVQLDWISKCIHFLLIRALSVPWIGFTVFSLFWLDYPPFDQFHIIAECLSVGRILLSHLRLLLWLLRSVQNTKSQADFCNAVLSLWICVTCNLSLQFDFSSFAKILSFGAGRRFIPENCMLAEGLLSWSNCKYTVSRMSWPLDFCIYF